MTHQPKGQTMTEARAVPPDFEFPWNRTVTMADVWWHEERKKRRARLYRKRNFERKLAYRASLRREADLAANYSAGSAR